MEGARIQGEDDWSKWIKVEDLEQLIEDDKSKDLVDHSWHHCKDL